MSLADLYAGLESNVEQLDMMDEQDAFRRAEELAVDLENIRDELLANQGVNRMLATAMESIQAGIIPEEYPINSFTQAYSKTNYKVSQEAIDIALATAIGVFVGAMLTILAKLLRWMYQALFNSTKSAQKAEVAGKNLALLADESRRLQQIMNKEDLARANTKTKEVIANAEQELSAMHNDLLRDLLTNGEIRSTMKTIGSRLDSYLAAVNEKLKVLKTVSEKAAGYTNDSNKVALLAQISTIIKEIPAGPSASAIDSVTKSKSGGGLRASLNAFHDYVMHAREQRSTPVFKYQSLIEVVRGGRLKLDETYLPNSEKTVENIGRLEKAVEGINNKLDSAKGIDQELASTIRSAGAVIKGEVDALRQFTALINTCISSVNAATALSLKTTTAVYQVLVAEAAASAQETIQDQARRSREEVRDKIQRK